MTLPHEFEAGGGQFQLHSLPLKESQAIYREVVLTVKPLVGLFGDLRSATTTAPTDDEDTLGATDASVEQSFIDVIAKHLSEVADATVEIPKLRDAFAKHCKTKVEATGDNWVDLSKWLDVTFRRKHGRFFKWLAECIAFEFGDILKELGLTL